MGLQNPPCRVRFVDPVPWPRGADTPTGPSKPGGEVQLLGGVPGWVDQNTTVWSQMGQGIRGSDPTPPTNSQRSWVVPGRRQLGWSKGQNRHMKEEQWDALISTDGSRVWPSGKAPPFQGGPDGFDSRGPLHGVAGLAERRGNGFPSHPHAFESRIPLHGSVSPTGKAPGWRPGTRETACEFESRRFRHGEVAEWSIAAALKAVAERPARSNRALSANGLLGESGRPRRPVTAKIADSNSAQAASWGVAQLEERRSLKSEATGSKPVTPANLPSGPTGRAPAC